MSKKRNMTYAEMQRAMQSMQKQMEAERQRVIKVIADVLMTEENAVLLGEFSDAELKKVTALLSKHIPACVAQVKAEKQAGAAQPPADN